LRFDLTLALADRPGQLLRALEPIAKNGGNIISVIHERERFTASVYVPVSLVVDFPAYDNFRKAREDLKKIDVSVTRSEEVIETASVTAILIGKIDLEKIVDAKIRGLRIVDFEVLAPTSKEACIRLNVEIPVELIDESMRELKRISKEENAILITSV
jgi:ACT domain-containing protein